MTRRTTARRMPARDLALVATAAALVAVLGLVPPLTPFGSQVPITAQTLGVMLAGSLLGARRGFLALLTFLVLVAAGLPLLAGGRGGLGVFAGPSAGYLLAWPLGAAVTGWLADRGGARYSRAWGATANAVGGVVVVYCVGIPVSAWVTDVPVLVAAAGAGVFLPGDGVKVAVGTVVAAAVHRGYPVLRRDDAASGARVREQR